MAKDKTTRVGLVQRLIEIISQHGENSKQANSFASKHGLSETDKAAARDISRLRKGKEDPKDN